MVEIGNVRPGDSAELLAGLREIDRLEIQAGGYEDPGPPVEFAFTHSVLAWTARVDSHLLACFGVAEGSPGTGAPWMLATESLRPHARVLAGLTPEYIARMRERFPVLVNTVWAGHDESVRWLRRVGFTVRAPEQHPRTGQWFHQFDMGL